MKKMIVTKQMNRVVVMLIGFLFLGCDSEKASDCFQRTGDLVKIQVDVDRFTKILVNPNVEVILKKGEKTKVVIETGKNLLNEVSATVTGDRLVLSDTNDCSFFRAYNQTKILVTAPDIKEIRSATQFAISSDGILDYPSLKLFSEDFTEKEGTTTGIFDLKVNTENIAVVGNNITSFFIEGATKSLNVNIASGTGRFEAPKLIAQKVYVFHRGTNTIIVNPIASIEGEIRSTGDVILTHKPSHIAVEEFFTGKLILP